MSVVLDPAGDDALTSPLAGPLSSIEIHAHRGGDPKACTAPRRPSGRPLALRELRPAPQRDVPEYLYDPIRQVATDPNGEPLGPDLAKDWTTIEGTHTDGDGGDNELWEWEEVK